MSDDKKVEPTKRVGRYDKIVRREVTFTCDTPDETGRAKIINIKSIKLDE